MAKNKAAIKRTRQAQGRQISNMSRKTYMKSSIKKFEAAIADDNRAEAEVKLIAASSIVDKNASRGIVHKNKAARIKSRMTKKLNDLAL